MTTFDEEVKHPLNSRMFACPAQGNWTSFKFVDELGEGLSYAGLNYSVIDSEGQVYKGTLDRSGIGKVDNHFSGPISIILVQKYTGKALPYKDLIQRDHYPLPITELQVRAEQTRYVNEDGSRTQSNPAQACADYFCQVEVRHLVKPAKIHFLDDRGQKNDTDTQAFITHNDELVLISVRGTSELLADALRDADAFQTPFGKEGLGKVHRGFYDAALKVYELSINYLEKFYTGQKLIICGHSLGGAITLLLSEMLRRRTGYEYKIVLYTYGAPRAADSTFVKGAADLVHYRMVNHNDPVPSVPATWMNTKPRVYLPGAALTFFNAPLGIAGFVAGITNLTGEPYEHHGTLQHFMPVAFGAIKKSSIMWEPGCDTITEHAACTLAIHQNNGLPEREGFIAQIFDADNHSMTGGYIPGCWAALRRWQEALTLKHSLVTDEEFEHISRALATIIEQLRFKRRMLGDSPTPYSRAHELTINALNREVDKVHMTFERLKRLRQSTINENRVYGSFSTQPDLLSECLLRWDAHPENKVPEQLAMTPAPDVDDDLLASINGHAVGAPYTFDIDSLF
ncbi:lipase family protein [Pseudomonas sp. CCI3.1]|uniref:lipase family protein n=1 Tax=Pseudomonas sp. CCI3.1 TaxID=3048618 RepID=UPI002AB47D25|nr:MULTISPECIES: lipase family protein [unclassified Pseudomonas]MDY7581864.1 lipase family protein [Pseudomonas sp. CCI3.1]MEB0065523.1 lipase family protein [Pseudomonas sp. CCI3.1]MEB0070670.1 lipase family protein [Pseudomonas sp. CCI1.4]